MRYLVSGNANPTSDGCNLVGSPCPPDTSGCPYLCIMYCPTKVENCRPPIGPGFSPTDNGIFIDK